MKWKIMKQDGRFWVCRKTWQSPDWMGIVKKDLRVLSNRRKEQMVEVWADCANRELAVKLLALLERSENKVSD
ncbi:hypothetical protein [Marinicrinis sediminis]|uniref:Uncharacterized protein n=1 Tax=Marinicrinis sediminis TaxID=1652465 RepID=A0ABW5R8L1_9BACL